MSNIATKLSEVSAVKSALKGALTAKGIDMTNVPFTEYANKIEEIKTSDPFTGTQIFTHLMTQLQDGNAGSAGSLSTYTYTSDVGNYSGKVLTSSVFYNRNTSANNKIAYKVRALVDGSWVVLIDFSKTETYHLGLYENTVSIDGMNITQLEITLTRASKYYPARCITSIYA